MSVEHDTEIERQYRYQIGRAFLCEVRIIERLAKARIAELAGGIRPSEEKCSCPYCRYPEAER